MNHMGRSVMKYNDKEHSILEVSLLEAWNSKKGLSLKIVNQTLQRQMKVN